MLIYNAPFAKMFDMSYTENLGIDVRKEFLNNRGFTAPRDFYVEVTTIQGVFKSFKGMYFANCGCTHSEEKRWHREISGTPWKACFALFVFDSVKSTIPTEVFHRDYADDNISNLKIYRTSLIFAKTVASELNTHLGITDLVNIGMSYLGYEIEPAHERKIKKGNEEMSDVSSDESEDEV